MNDAPPSPSSCSSAKATSGAENRQPAAHKIPHTVAARLGISVPSAIGLSRFDGTPHPAPPPPRRPPSGLPWSEVERRLGPLQRDMEAGVADRLLAKKAGVSVRAVRKWRRSRFIVGRRGRTPRTLDGALYFRELLPTGLPTSVEHPVDTINPGFRVPSYVLRVPLDYTVLVEAVWRLCAGGLSLSQISAAIGIAVPDLEMAVRYAEQGRLP